MLYQKVTTIDVYTAIMIQYLGLDVQKGLLFFRNPAGGGTLTRGSSRDSGAPAGVPVGPISWETLLFYARLKGPTGTQIAGRALGARGPEE